MLIENFEKKCVISFMFFALKFEHSRPTLTDTLNNLAEDSGGSGYRAADTAKLVGGIARTSGDG